MSAQKPRSLQEIVKLRQQEEFVGKWPKSIPLSSSSTTTSARASFSTPGCGPR